MILFVAGSRRYPNPEEVLQFLHDLHVQMPGTILVTGKHGIVADTAEQYAKAVGMDLVGLKPTQIRPGFYQMTAWAYGDRAQALVQRERWREVRSSFDTFGACAMFRSMYGVGVADRLVAFWDGVSPGTAQEIEFARVKKIPISVKRPGVPMQQVNPQPKEDA